MNYIDILLCVLILLGAIQGYRKGLISSLFSLGGTIFGLGLAAKNYGSLYQWLEQNTPLSAWLQASIYKRVLSLVEAKAQAIQEQTLDKILSMFPEELRGLLSEAWLPKVHGYTDSYLQEIAQNFTSVLVDSFMKILAFALIYFGVVIAVELISSLILASLGIFSGVIDGGGGFLVGGLVSFIGLAVIIGLLTPMLSLFRPGILEVLESSILYPYLLQTYAYIADFFQLAFSQGLTLPSDWEEWEIPIDLKNLKITDPNLIDL